jgi:large subunit ribosomal protein L24
MRFKVGDQVIVTGGKDKGKTGKIVRVLPKEEAVVVEGVNMYVKHIKPMQDRAGQRTQLARPLPTAKVAILNDKNQPDRIGYQVTADGQKNRVFKKTGELIKDHSEATKSK